MSGSVRGTNEFKEMWLMDDLNVDLDIAFMGDYTTAGGLLYQLSQQKVAQNGVILDTTELGDAPLMAGAFVKLEGNGDPSNTGKERAKVTIEAKVDGLQKVADMTVFKKILGFNGKTKIAYHLDRRLGVVEKAVDQKIKVSGDGTNNIAYVTTITGEQVGTQSEIYQRRTIPSLLAPENLSPSGISSTGNDNPRIITLDWDDVPGATGYDIEVSRVTAPAGFYVSESSVISEKDISIECGLDPAFIVYSWRVRGKTATILGAWSDPVTFQAKYTSL
jgi:hypothetical protein